jgi:predicted Ser/Thr protein kinase
VENRLTNQSQEAVRRALRRATDAGHPEIEPLHLLVALLEDDGGRALAAAAGADAAALHDEADALLDRLPAASGASVVPPRLAGSLARLVGRVTQEAGDGFVSVADLLGALAGQDDPCGRLMRSRGATRPRMAAALEATERRSAPDDGQEAVRSPHARDLTLRARGDGTGPFLGREAESRRLIEILSRREGGNALLVGERGVGKSALIAGFARQVAGMNVPSALLGARVVALDPQSMPDGELDRIMTEAARRGGVVLVLDDLHAAVRPGSPVLAALGRLAEPGAPRIIATTTPGGERDRLAGLPVLYRHFQRLPVAEASVEDTTMILRGLRAGFEEHHQIAIRDAALVAAARLANRIRGRFLPGGAVELVDEAAARLRMDLQEGSPELRELDQRASRLNIERLALLKEGDDASRRRVAEVERELSDVRTAREAVERRRYQARLDRERTADLGRQVETVRAEAERAQRDGDLETAARLLYGELPELERRWEAAEEHATAGGRLDDGELDEDHVARMVADALDISVEQLHGGFAGPASVLARTLGPRTIPPFQDIPSAESSAAESMTAGSGAAEAKAAEPPAAESPAAEPQAAEPGAAEPQAAEPRAAEPRAAEPRPSGNAAPSPEPTGVGLWPGDPRTLGEYRLLRRLGQGGQGVVYLAENAAGRRVAVKVLHAAALDHPRARERFFREIDAARRVASFCTAQVLDADFAGELPYVVSEYVPGPSLRRAVSEDGTRSGGALDRLAIGTITALAAIAEAGIVHRDFKPDNVLLGPDGPRVIDFGIARITDAGSSVTGQAIGTPAYMAPEQIEGGRIGPAADVYAWACTMVHAATGRPPHGADSIPQIMYRKLRGEADLGDFPARASGTLRALVGEGLRTAPGERPAARDVLLRLIGHDAPAPTRLLAEGAARATGAP